MTKTPTHYHSCCGKPVGECPGCAEGSCLQEKASIDKKDKAVLVTGNPKYIKNNPEADTYYQAIEDYLAEQGYSVSRDPGEPYTEPAPASVWLGHSRGVDRLRFAPKGTQTLAFGSGVGGAINHPKDLNHKPGDVPTSAHYQFTDEMKQAITALRAQKQQKESMDNQNLKPTRVRVVMPHGKGYLMERMNNKKYPATLGRIRLPGGGIDPGETARQAAIREMAEELSLKLKEKNLKSMGIYPDGTYGAEEYFQYDGEHGAAPGNYTANFGGDKEIELIEGQTNDPNYWGSQLDALQKKETMDKQAGLLTRKLKEPNVISAPSEDGGEVAMALEHTAPRMLAAPFMSTREDAIQNAAMQLAMMNPAIMQQYPADGEPRNLDADTLRQIGLTLAYGQPDRFSLHPDAQAAIDAEEPLDKQSVNRGLGDLPSGDGPQQMQYSLQALDRARAAVDPTETLAKNKLDRDVFDQNIRAFAASNNPDYKFNDYARDKQKETIKGSLLGALVGGGLGALGGYLTNAPMQGAFSGAALGGGAGGALGYNAAATHNDNLLRTAKTLKTYGLNRPSYLKKALPLLTKESKSKGLWANIHAKRKRGGKPAKPGSKAYPSAKEWKKNSASVFASILNQRGN